MAHRPHAALIREARRAALRARLIGDGLLPDQADGWIDMLMLEGGDPDTAAYWEAAYKWIVRERASGRAAPDSNAGRNRRA